MRFQLIIFLFRGNIAKYNLASDRLKKALPYGSAISIEKIGPFYTSAFNLILIQR